MIMGTPVCLMAEASKACESHPVSGRRCDCLPVSSPARLSLSLGLSLG